MEVLSNPTQKTVHITDQYVWLPTLHSLPAQISYDVTCQNETDEFLPCFSFTKAEWDSPECDALSWYASPHRDDFTFRTQLFRNFPKVERFGNFKPAVGTKFNVQCIITETTATYYINDKKYATATYSKNDIPEKGYFGFATYKKENIVVENINDTLIHITDKYVWLPELQTLPVEISNDVICMKETDEFLPCFSFTKAEWDSPECDALSWYVSPHRDDFTFRTELFRNFPTVKRTGKPFKPAVGVKFNVKCVINQTSATYAINGEPYATATYEVRTIPKQGYLGFAKYKEEDIIVANIKILKKGEK